MKYFIVLVAIIACTNAAPVTEVSEVSEASPAADMKAALQPIQNNMRAMYDNAEYAVKDLAQMAAKSVGDLAADAKELVHPNERSSPHNYLAEVKSLINNAQGKGAELMNRVIADLKPIQANERSALLTAKDAMRMLEEKYLTSDGQQLVKTLTRMVPFINNNNNS